MSWDDLAELVNDTYDYFIRFIKELLDIYAPLKEVVIPRKYICHKRSMDNSRTTKILLHTG